MVPIVQEVLCLPPGCDVPRRGDKQEACFSRNQSVVYSRLDLTGTDSPARVEFFGTNWCWLGSRFWLRAIIHKITNIPLELLGRCDGILRQSASCQERSKLDAYSVAQKMSWAAPRVCTRTEDLAYCLLGLFGINMPLLYGEGYHA